MLDDANSSAVHTTQMNHINRSGDPCRKNVSSGTLAVGFCSCWILIPGLEKVRYNLYHIPQTSDDNAQAPQIITVDIAQTPQDFKAHNRNTHQYPDHATYYTPQAGNVFVATQDGSFALNQYVRLNTNPEGSAGMHCEGRGCIV